VHLGAIDREKITATDPTPFYEIAELILDFLKGYKETHPDDWN
jgi:hypothetical protein